jgi:hypothetical protein
VHALPVLVVEMPAPAGREDEWNRWYEEVHIPDLQQVVPEVVHTTRYRLLAGDDDVLYVVFHEFETIAALQAYLTSPLIEARGVEYTRLWGTRRAVRLRAFSPIFERRSQPDED